MKIIVDVNIISTNPDNKHVVSVVRREYDSALVPMIGMELEDSAWKDPKKIQRVTINPSDGYYYLFVSDDEYSTAQQCEQMQNMYVAHDWKRLGL